MPQFRVNGCFKETAEVLESTFCLFAVIKVKFNKVVL